MQDCQRKFVQIGHCQLETLLIGTEKSEKSTIVILHEGLGCVDMWRKFPFQLHEKTGHPVVAYSREGYGNSSVATLPRPLDYMQQEAIKVLPRFLQSLKLKRFILLGHSDGASISSIYNGLQDETNPEAAILMAPHFFVEDIALDQIEKAKAFFEDGNLRQGLEKYHGANTEGAFWGWNGAWLHPDFKEWNITEYLKTGRAPLLVLQGAEDEYGTMAQLDCALENYQGKCNAIILDNCRHSPHLDQPDRCLQAINAFLKESVINPDGP